MDRDFVCRFEHKGKTLHGTHVWDIKGVDLGDIRTCQLCGRREKLVPDYGGWTPGYWVEEKGDGK